MSQLLIKVIPLGWAAIISPVLCKIVILVLGSENKPKAKASAV